MANNCPRIFPTTKRRPSYLLSTTGLYEPRSQVRPLSAHTTNSVQQMRQTSTKPTLPHPQPPGVIETHSANFQQTAGWGQTYPPHSVFERSHPGCASQPFHSTYAGWFLPSRLISSHPLYRVPSAHLTNSSHHAREVGVLMSYRRGESHRDKVARRIRTSRALNDSSR